MRRLRTIGWRLSGVLIALVCVFTLNVFQQRAQAQDLTSLLSQFLQALYQGNVVLPGGVKFADGTAAAPSITFASEPITGVYRYSASQIGISLAGVLTARWSGAGYINTIGSIINLNNSGSFQMGAGQDVVLARDAANVLALKNGTNAQEMRVYGTTTGGHYVKLANAGNYAHLTTVGGADGIYFGTNDTLRWAVSGTGDLSAYGDNLYDIGTVGDYRPKNIYVASGMAIGAPTGGVGGAGIINAKGFKIDGVDVATSSDTYWNAEAPGISYASPIGLNTTPIAGSPITAAITWNSGATTFTGIKLNVTDTASDAASLLMVLQVGGASRFNVTKGGSVAAGTNPASAGAVRLANNGFIVGRDSGNSADINLIGASTGNKVQVGSASYGLYVDGNALQFSATAVTPASSGTRYLCISTTGVVTSSASACSGT